MDPRRSPCYRPVTFPARAHMHTPFFHVTHTRSSFGSLQCHHQPHPQAGVIKCERTVLFIPRACGNSRPALSEVRGGHVSAGHTLHPRSRGGRFAGQKWLRLGSRPHRPPPQVAPSLPKCGPTPPPPSRCPGTTLGPLGDGCYPIAVLCINTSQSHGAPPRQGTLSSLWRRISAGEDPSPALLRQDGSRGSPALSPWTR